MSLGKWLPLLLEPLTFKISHLGFSPQFHDFKACVAKEHYSRSISALSLSYSTLGSYCIQSRAEVHVTKMDLFSKQFCVAQYILHHEQFCVAQYILHHEQLSCSPLCSPEILLASAQYVVMLSIIFLLVQEHRPTLFAPRRCAANHTAEYEEFMDVFLANCVRISLGMPSFPGALLLARLSILFKNLGLSFRGSGMQRPFSSAVCTVLLSYMV